MRFLLRLTLFAAPFVAALTFIGPAEAHPHVWVSMKTQVMVENGQVMALKQAWTFDEAFTAFALQGLKQQKDGSYGDDVLKPLAEVNVTSLKEYDYFVKAKTATAKIALKDPVNYYLTYEDEALTLHFTLPLAKPVPAKGNIAFEIFDPTYFVAFGFARTEPVALAGAPQCAFKVVAPDQQAQTAPLGEAFFSSLDSSSTYGAQYADKILVNCP